MKRDDGERRNWETKNRDGRTLTKETPPGKAETRQVSAMVKVTFSTPRRSEQRIWFRVQNKGGPMY